MKVTSVKLARVEGFEDECVTVVVPTLEEASRVLGRWARTAPEGGCYDKCDFAVTWADGEKYEGRVDLEHKHVGGYDLLGHMRDFAGFLAGVLKPAWMDDALWETARERHLDQRAEALALYARLEN